MGGYTRGMSRRKLLRNQAIRDYAQAHPELILREIGEAFGLTKQRVWAILHGNSKRKEASHD